MKKISKMVMGAALMLALGAGVFANVAPARADGEVMAGVNATGASTEGPTNLQTGVLPTVINTMFFIIGALAVIMIIYSGTRYVTSAGNTTAVTSAKNTLMYSVVGLVVAIFAYAIVNWVVTSFAKK